jgi:hypothetical protein
MRVRRLLSGAVLGLALASCGTSSDLSGDSQRSVTGGVTSTGGNRSYGGKAAGGTSAGGATTGGNASYGGSSGKATGGTGGTYTPSGGKATGGTYTPSGGTSTGGKATGGTYTPSGGTSTGGKATGGTYTPSGGTTTGGAPTGGTSPTCVVGSTQACVCFDGSPGAQLCQANGTFADCRCLLTEVRQRLVGTWVGTRRTPWEGEHPVTMTFTSDGHYSAHCLDGCIALYYGSDSDSSEKTYQITQVNSDGTGFGEIAIWFSAGNTNRGEISNLGFNSDGNTVAFTVYKDNYGPLDFTLTRQ